MRTPNHREVKYFIEGPTDNEYWSLTHDSKTHVLKSPGFTTSVTLIAQDMPGAVEDFCRTLSPGPQVRHSPPGVPFDIWVEAAPSYCWSGCWWHWPCPVSSVFAFLALCRCVHDGPTSGQTLVHKQENSICRFGMSCGATVYMEASGTCVLLDFQTSTFPCRPRTYSVLAFIFPLNSGVRTLP